MAKLTRAKFWCDRRLPAGPFEGWCFLFGGRSAHYFRLEVSLCRKYAIEPTVQVFQVPLERLAQICPTCRRAHAALAVGSGAPSP
jgi:hypothetical protein